MARVHTPYLAFNRGEVSPLALTRIDAEKLRLAAETQENWMPLALGPMMLRPGSKYIATTRSSAKARYLEFIFGKTDTALLEFTDSHLRFLVSDTLVTRPSNTSTVQAIASWDYTTGTTTDSTASSVAGVATLAAIPRGGVACGTALVTYAAATKHFIRFTVTNGPVTVMGGTTSGESDLLGRTIVDTGIHSIALTANPSANWYLRFENTDRRTKTISAVAIESSGTLDIASPYLLADLPNIRYTQSGDIVYLTCAGYQQRKIERRGTRDADAGWSIVLYRSHDGPFAAAAYDDVTLLPSVYEGNGTLTASRNFFKGTHDGAMFRIFTPGQAMGNRLGAANAVSESVRQTGVGAGRAIDIVITGTWVGTLAYEYSLDGPDEGFIENATTTANGTTSTGTGAGDNIIQWWRVKFKTYTSGSAVVTFSGTGAGSAGGIGGRLESTTATDAKGGLFGICRVTGYTSPTVVNIEVLSPFSALVASNNWQEGEWSLRVGYPTAVAFHDGRLWFAGRDRLWGSESDNYTGFSLDVEGDSAPILRTVGFGPADSINWLLSLSRMIAGREMSEVSVRSSTQDEPITPTNFSVKDCSTQGSAKVQGVKVDRNGIYVQQSKKKIYELSYNTQAGDYASRDLTRLHPDVGLNSLTDIGVQRQPDTRLHFVRDDGQVVVLVYDPSDEVEAFYRVKMGGTGTDGNGVAQSYGIVEDVVVLPADEEDAVYYVVKRTVNGGTVRYLEKLAKRSECIGGLLSKNLDSHVSYTGGATGTLTGLSHLEGQTVAIWVNGAQQTSQVVSGGQVVGILPQATNAVVGLPYTAVFVSAKLAYAAKAGTALTQKKRVDQIGFVLANTHYQGLQFGPDASNLDNLPLVEDGATTAADYVWSYYDKGMIPSPHDWSTDSRLYLKATSPRPVTVSAAVIGIETNEGPGMPEKGGGD
jgi:hypothetical protein